MESHLLKLTGISKSFPGVLALEGVDLELSRGEVLALVGENGAGKSTLMKIISGIERADSGSIILDGLERTFASPQDAISAGISLIHQELNLAENLDIGGAIFLGREPKRFGFLDKRSIQVHSKRILSRVGLERSPSTKISELSLAERQMVEIAKALSIKSKIIVMDEPTSSLTEREAQILLGLVGELRERGLGIIYISHRLPEVEQVADRVVVLKDGKFAGALSKAEISKAKIVNLMVGRELSQVFPPRARKPGLSVLKVKELTTSAYPRESMSFELRSGEILGVSGLIGSGRTELLEALFGAVPGIAGSVEVGQFCGLPKDIREGVSIGFSLVPEDRRRLGIVTELSVGDNLVLPFLKEIASCGVVNPKLEHSRTEGGIAKFGVKCGASSQKIKTLSGGNQQKVALAKWLIGKSPPKVLLLDEPTRGVDVGAKEEIYQLVRNLTLAGLAVIWVSSELEEVIGISDRILVMHEGSISGELPGEGATEEAIMRLATGGRENLAA